MHTIADLQKVAAHAQAGFTLEFNDREDGNRGLNRLYGLHLRVKTMEPALRYQAMQRGEIQITDAYSTDSELREYDLLILQDKLQLFPPYQGAPLLRQETLQRHPELQTVLQRLAGRITAQEMQEMNYRVKAQGDAAADVARQYLQERHLIP